MSIPLLATKLYVPTPRPHLVARPRLIQRLNDSLHRRLTLISAPAGFGKSTLVSAWIADCPRPAAWLTLDEGENELARFLTYLVAALQTVAAHVGNEVLSVLHSPQPPPTEAILTALVNEITTIPDDFMLVMDDYHLLEAPAVDQALAFLLAHLPSRMHLVIATREDPQLPLSRLRARGQMTELRAADLRFTCQEATEFLNQAMGLELTDQEVATLETHTEGWIAGLQLAALSMQGRKDVAGFIRAFAGDNRYIVDYLVEEVLQHQPQAIRDFLLQTSILDRLSGPLCDAVTGGAAGAELLEILERGNLFVVPLDDKRHWFRYHHLFADVLRAHLIDQQPDLLPTLHRRASHWYQQNGSPAGGLRHALAAQDFARAAELAELAWPAMERGFQTATWLGWVKALPAEVIRARPVLSASFAWALLNKGELEVAERHLRNAEQWLDAGSGQGAPPAGMLVADQAQYHGLPAVVASARAYLAQALGDISNTVKYGRQALACLPEKEHLQRGVAAALLGLAYWARGELAVAHDTLAGGLAAMRTAGNLLFSLRGTYALADIRLAQGRLRDAIATYEHALQLAEEQGGLTLRGATDLYWRLSELYLEQDNLAAATAHLHKGEELGKQAATHLWRLRLCLAQARTKRIQGDLDGALRLLNQAERLYIRTPIPEVVPIPALKARVWVAQGRLDEALDWVRAQGLAVDDELAYLHEYEQITLARVLLAQYRRDQDKDAIRGALKLLERLFRAAEVGGRTGSVMEILLLQALAHQAQGRTSLALPPLIQALALAEPEGYVRTFIHEGLPMAHLLAAVAAQGTLPAYTGRLLAAFQSQERERAEQPARPPVQPLVEPLSPRELEILQLIAQGYSNREIGQRLFIALDTVKGHNRRIFGKLQVQRRTEAVACARELGLL